MGSSFFLGRFYKLVYHFIRQNSYYRTNLYVLLSFTLLKKGGGVPTFSSTSDSYYQITAQNFSITEEMKGNPNKIATILEGNESAGIEQQGVVDKLIALKNEKVSLPAGRSIVYLLLFVLAIAIVFRGIPYVIGLVVIPAVLLFVDRKALKMVDYPLLLTFVFFFIFAGNMARIEVVREFFSALLDKSTLLVSTLSCQVISNVPSAILLSQFTENYAALLVVVNIGGVGTLTSSLASLITFREYTNHAPGKSKSYVLLFSAFNFAFLIILTGVMLVIKAF